MISKGKTKNLDYLLMLAPPLIAVILIFVYALGRMFQLSLYKVGLPYGQKFAGFSNYLKVLSDKVFCGQELLKNIIF